MKPTEDFPTAAAAESLPQLDDPRVLLAVEEYLAAHKAGHGPERHDFLARHPGIAAALDDCREKCIKFFGKKVRRQEGKRNA